MNYELCRRHYLSAPGLGLDAILNMTKVELDLISDPDMHIFFEKGTRGEAFYISIRYSKGNKKYLNSLTQNKNQNLLYT